jgi:hypothetical protein
MVQRQLRAYPEVHVLPLASVEAATLPPDVQVAEPVSYCAPVGPMSFLVKDGSPHELRDAVLIVQPLGGIEDRVIVEMVSRVLSHPFKCRFLGGYVFQLRRELDDNRAIV